MVLYNHKATALGFLKWLPYHEMSLWSLEIKGFNINILRVLKLFQAKQTTYWKEAAKTSLSVLPQLSEVRWIHWHLTAHICTSMMPNRWLATWTGQSWWSNMEKKLLLFQLAYNKKIWRCLIISVWPKLSVSHISVRIVLWTCHNLIQPLQRDCYWRSGQQQLYWTKQQTCHILWRLSLISHAKRVFAQNLKLQQQRWCQHLWGPQMMPTLNKYTVQNCHIILIL